jgi:hypothetical protein
MPNKNLFVIIYFGFALFSVTAQASQTANQQAWQTIGQATATWLWQDIYQATLLAQQPLSAHFLQDGEALRLQLCYQTAMSADILVKGANGALPQNLSPALQQAVNALHQSYQNVTQQDCYELVHTAPSQTQLLFNSKPVFSTELAGFKAVYFGIWLGDNPLSESLKQNILNLK